ncbi:MAG: Mu-like prophage major head subunit gpT family protein [Thermoguttaceae bacterium]
MSETILNFRCDVTLHEQSEGEVVCDAATNCPKFSMRAYTGAVANVRGFEHPIIVDLIGVIVKSQRIPIRRDHKEWASVGHSTKIDISGGIISASGIISRDNDVSRDIVHSGKLGFPWQASIGGPVHKTRFLAQGQKEIVNGKSVEGPLHIVQKMTLKEISFVEYGADPNTSANVEAIAVSMPEGTSNHVFLTGSVNIQDQSITEKELMTNSLVQNQDAQMKDSIHTAPQAPATLPKTEPEVTNQPVVSMAAPALLNLAEEAIAEYRSKLAAEKERIRQIEQRGNGRHPELEMKAIVEGWSFNQFELEYMRKDRAEYDVSKAPQQLDLQSNSRVLEVIALSASGLPVSAYENKYDAAILEKADKMRGMGLQEFCQHACGTTLPSYKRDSHGWLTAAFSTTSLPNILSNVANKMLLDGYNYVEDAWRKICKIASVTDFKAHRRFRLTGSFKFEQVGAQGELKHGMIGEQEFMQQAQTHGIMFALTRQMIIDDDLGALTDIPRQIGMGAAEAIADAVWQLLLANPQQKDGKPFFDAAHGNYMAGADTALSVNALTAAEVKFGSQTKPVVEKDNKKVSRPLGIMPSILLVPIAQKVIAEMLMKATTLNETTEKGYPVANTNPHTGKYNVVSSTYLSNSHFNGASPNAWYLMADPNRVPSIEVAFLGGVDRPTIERADADFNTLGIQFRGYIDFGVKEQDYRGALKVKGEA